MQYWVSQYFIAHFNQNKLTLQHSLVEYWKDILNNNNM